MSAPTNQGDSAPREKIELLAPAKINLFLYVTGRRPDGYHELYSLMCGISLYDRMTVHMGGARNAIFCDATEVPSDESNLALKAALVFNGALAETGRTVPQNLSIHLEKNIPSGAGLGGGSSDAAAVLKGLNRHYNRPFSHGQLHKMALSLGADVPFFIEAKPAVACGIGEQLTPYEGLPPLWVVLIYPGFGISTARVFKNLNFTLTKSEKELRYFPFKNGNLSAFQHLHNDLEQGVGAHFPVIEKNKKDLLNQGAIASLMTGSGSVVFGLFVDEINARNAMCALNRQTGTKVMVAQLLI